MGTTRRAFIQMSIGATAGILFTPVPWKLADDVSIWTQNWPWIPRLEYGEQDAVAAVSKICPSGCAVRVERVAGKPYATEGNPDNPLSGGGICPLCSSGVQLMYSPVRVKAPMKKSGDGFEEITWDEAVNTLADKLKAAGGKTAAISGDAGGTANEVLSGLLAGLGSSSYYMMPGPAQAAAKAFGDIMGGTGQLGYDLENSDFVLLIGADALDSWGPTVRNQMAFGAGGEFAYAGSVVNRSAAVSEDFVPVAPGGEAAFALGLAYFLLQSGRAAAAGDFYDFRSMVTSKFSPDQVEKVTGVPQATLKTLAAKLLGARRPVVVADSGSGAAAVTAGAALNLLLGGLNASGGMKALPRLPKAVAGAMDAEDILANDLVADMAGGKFNPEVLLVYEANPAYALPQAEKMAQVLDGVPFLVSFSTYMDETAQMADLILPNAHPYERFDDLASPFGVGKVTYVASAPVMQPALNVMATADLALALASGLGIDLGYETFEEVLQAKAEAAGADWGGLLEGAAFESDSVEAPASLNMGAGVLAKAAAAAKGSGQLAVAPFLRLNVGSDRIATPAHNAATIGVDVLRGKEMLVQINHATAKQLGVGEGDKVKLSSTNGDVTALVHVSETVMTGVVAAPLGLGHTAWDEFSKDKGDNVFKILTVNSEPGTGMAMWSGSTVNVAKI